jgi:hypothetical protein
VNAHETNCAMLAAADAAERMFEKLTRARARKASPLLLAGLGAAYAQCNERVNQLWDAWNDVMLRERIARIYA